MPVLSEVVPGGLPRGAVVVVEQEVAGDPGRRGASGGAPGAGDGPGGATTLAFALLAAATGAGAWCGAVGVSDVGVLGVAELGVDLDRLILVPGAGSRWAEVAAVLMDGLDAVMVCPPSPVRPGVARRLAARARERRSALVVLARRAPWPEGPDLRLTVAAGRWQGVGVGHGHLQGRQVEVVAAGRRAATRSTRVAMRLPGSSGAVEEQR